MTLGNDVRAKQIDYQIHTEHSPLYRFLRIQLNNIPSSQITADNTSQLLEWKLPSNGVYNLSRSYISYNLPIPDVNAKANWTHEDQFTLGQDISFGTAGDQKLCDLKFAPYFTKIARKIETKLDDYISNDSVDQLYPCNSLPATNFYPAWNVNNTLGTVAYLEPRYTNVPVIGNGVDAGLVNKFVNYPLSAFKKTILALDKDLYFGNEMFLRINTNPLNRQCFTSNNATDPTGGTAADAPNTIISKIYLYLAVEQNDLIAESIRAKFNSGAFKINIPYTVGFSQSTSVVGPTNINVQITKQYGKRLLQVLYTVFNSNNIRDNAYDCDNWNSIKLSDYRTALDSKYLQDYSMSCLNPVGTSLNSDDWYQANKKYCKDTVILNKDVYKKNWFHMDRFYQEHDDVSSENLDVGLELTNHTMNYIIEGTAVSAALIHYVFATFRRTVVFNKDGVFFDTDSAPRQI